MRRLRVKELLQERKISMGKLSRDADIPISTVVRLCKEPVTYNPTGITLFKVADYLGLKVDDLYIEDDSQPDR